MFIYQFINRKRLYLNVKCDENPKLKCCEFEFFCMQRIEITMYSAIFLNLMHFNTIDSD